MKRKKLQLLLQELIESITKQKGANYYLFLNSDFRQIAEISSFHAKSKRLNKLKLKSGYGAFVVTPQDYNMQKKEIAKNLVDLMQ